MPKKKVLPTREQLEDVLVHKGMPAFEASRALHVSYYTFKEAMAAHGFETRRQGTPVKINDRFGRLKVVGFDGDRQAHPVVECDCGTVRPIVRWLLNGGQQSCGCLRNETTRNTHWKGFAEISSTYWTSLQSGARRRDIKFEVDIENAWQIFLEQERRCALSGIVLRFEHDDRLNKTGEQTASLDRIDSLGDYTSDNIQWVHKDINYIKRDLSDATFISYCELVARNQAVKTLPGRHAA